MIFLILVLVGIVIFSFLVFLNYDKDLDDSKITVSVNQVVEVIDGDTFKTYGGEIVRLICIDTPEKGISGYFEAKEFLSELILDKVVSMDKDLEDKDAYGRSLRYVYADGLFVNQKMVQEGYAEVFRYGNNTARCNEIEGFN